VTNFEEKFGICSYPYLISVLCFMCVCWWRVLFCEYLLVLFGFVLVGGIKGLYMISA